jgi:hypothetical protein
MMLDLIMLVTCILSMMDYNVMLDLKCDVNYVIYVYKALEYKKEAHHYVEFLYVPHLTKWTSNKFRCVCRVLYTL